MASVGNSAKNSGHEIMVAQAAKLDIIHMLVSV